MSERQWKPGDVAILTFGNGTHAMYPEARGVRNPANDGWAHDGVFGGGLADDTIGGFVARPLVVIDPESAEQVEQLLRVQWRAFGNEHRFAAGDVAKRVTTVQAALREFADLKPPKPVEPQGLGAVVRDIEGILWTRVESGEPEARNPWYPADPDFQPDEWANLGVRSDDDVLSQGYEVQP